MLQKVITRLCELSKKEPNIPHYTQHLDKGIEILYNTELEIYTISISIVTNEIFKTETLCGCFRTIEEVIKYAQKYINLKVTITNY